MNALNKIKRILLSLKYKRPVEMVLWLQSDRQKPSILVDRLGKMERFESKDKLVPLYIEDMLSSDALKDIIFGYQNKEI